ncbi:MAG: hypothetical protein MZV70_28980 [Desulfobacterales bacterium]|nr:hypothetical protein [Desulfobacterales bacterium]
MEELKAKSQAGQCLCGLDPRQMRFLKHISAFKALWPSASPRPCRRLNPTRPAG